MAKVKTQFFCQECGYISSKWLGKCPACDEWSTMVEAPAEKKGTNGKEHSGWSVAEPTKPQLLSEVRSNDYPRAKTGLKELDRALGGGVVRGELVLIGGAPGIGKSTLLLQVAISMAKTIERPILYVSGEESAAQIKMRADRLKTDLAQVIIYPETNLNEVLAQAVAIQPALLVIDSVQTMFLDSVLAAPGSVGQVREVTAKLLRFAKETEIATVIIGHVTKDGNIAGPRILEHMVDAVLYFEGDSSHSFRILRAIKNRFGATNESGIFAMEEEGLVEVANPSAMLLAERSLMLPGAVVMPYLEGARTLMVEMQALTSTAYYGVPRRTAAGFDYNRLVLLLAVLEKRAGFRMADMDVYLNVVGGLKVAEPAADLAVITAVVSSIRNIPFDATIAVCGEVGLTGEVRSVARLAERINEAEALGFRSMIVPQSGLNSLLKNKKTHKVKENGKLELIGVKTVEEALALPLCN